MSWYVYVFVIMKNNENVYFLGSMWILWFYLAWTNCVNFFKKKKLDPIIWPNLIRLWWDCVTKNTQTLTRGVHIGSRSNLRWNLTRLVRSCPYLHMLNHGGVAVESVERLWQTSVEGCFIVSDIDGGNAWNYKIFNDFFGKLEITINWN